MKALIIAMFCVSYVPISAQSLLSGPHFAERPQTITYYALSHQPTRKVKKLLVHAIEKMRQRDFDAAISSLQSALALDRKSWDAHLNLGAAYFWKGDRESARAEFESATELDPANPLGYADLAVCDMRTGRDESAVVLARQALALDPANRLAKRVLEVERREQRRKIK